MDCSTLTVSRPMESLREVLLEPGTGLPPLELLVSTFCASMRVFNKLAAAAAESPPPPLACGTGEDFGTGVEGEVVVLAIEVSVWTNELRRGVFELEAPVGVVSDGPMGETDES